MEITTKKKSKKSSSSEQPPFPLPRPQSNSNVLQKLIDIVNGNNVEFKTYTQYRNSIDSIKKILTNIIIDCDYNQIEDLISYITKENEEENQTGIINGMEQFGVL